jgi:hypothetical protein
MRRSALAADALLVLFVLLLALATLAQVRHNVAVGPHGHAPHHPPVATRRAPRS